MLKFQPNTMKVNEIWLVALRELIEIQYPYAIPQTVPVRLDNVKTLRSTAFTGTTSYHRNVPVDNKVSGLACVNRALFLKRELLMSCFSTVWTPHTFTFIVSGGGRNLRDSKPGQMKTKTDLNGEIPLSENMCFLVNWPFNHDTGISCLYSTVI